jgi:hypothetical protein
MRRVIALSLIGLGTFLIVIAVVLPTFIVSQVIKFPLNEYETATFTATNASYLDAGTLAEVSPVTLRAEYTIKGDSAAGNSSTAVWSEFDYVYDTTNHREVQIATRTAAFDRKTGLLVQCCGESVNGTPVVQTGYNGYVFPIGTKKQTYDVFDTQLDKPVPAVYTGTGSVNGISTDIFVQNIVPTKIATVTVPGSLIGSSATSVAAPEYYSNHLIYSVDPETGAILNVNEHEQRALYNPATNTQALSLINADLIVTPASVADIVRLDNNGRSELNLLSTILPIVLGVVGAICLVVGFLFVRRSREDVEAGPTTPAPEQAAVPEASTRADLIPGFDGAPQESTAESASTAEATEVVPEAEATAEAPEAAASEAEAPEAEASDGAASDGAAPEAEASEGAESETAVPEAEAAETAAPETAATETASAPAAANGEAPAAAPARRTRRAVKPAAERNAGSE